MKMHIDINKPAREGPFFAYRVAGNKLKPLTKAKFLEVVHSATQKAGLEPLKGHGIWIGATLCYLL